MGCACHLKLDLKQKIPVCGEDVWPIFLQPQADERAWVLTFHVATFCPIWRQLTILERLKTTASKLKESLKSTPLQSATENSSTPALQSPTSLLAMLKMWPVGELKSQGVFSCNAALSRRVRAYVRVCT